MLMLMNLCCGVHLHQYSPYSPFPRGLAGMTGKSRYSRDQCLTSLKAYLLIYSLIYIFIHLIVESIERERLHYVHLASLAYEDGSVFMSGPFAEWL